MYTLNALQQHLAWHDDSLHARTPLVSSEAAADIAHQILSVDKAGKHWQKIFPGQVLVMPYEGLVANLTSAAQDMLQHCGMPWDDAVLLFHKTQRNVHTASLAQV